MNLGLSGLASGLDWHSLIDQLMQAERTPETRMQSEQSKLSDQKSAYASIQTELATLQTRASTLSDPSFFDNRVAQSSDTTMATVTATAGAPNGTFAFKFTQLATAAQQQGTSNVGKKLSPTNDVSTLTLGDAGFSTAVNSGTITVNGQQISLSTTDTLKAVFDKIKTATGGAVTATYDSTTDKISLASSKEIVLGSMTDTSNLLQVAKLYNNGSGAITSSTGLGGVKLSSVLTSSNLATTLSDGGKGAGEFKLNGVSISYNASSDSIQNVLDRINNSAAGVNASYDAINDRFVLVNKTEGDTGIGLQDVTGNFLAASGLLGGTLQRGKNLLYTVNGGGELTSQSNTITDATSGLTGISVTALQQGSANVTIGSDTTKIQTAVNDFLTEYNKTQSLLDTLTASSTDAQGKVTAGVLAGKGDANDISSQLRSLAYGSVTGLSTSLTSLADLGIDSNGNDNSLALTDSTKLTDALTNNLEAVKQLFTDPKNGVAVRLANYATQTSSDTGPLQTTQDNLTKQSGDIDTQISDLERRLTSEQQTLTDSFVNMETAQAKIKQQLSYLQQNFGASAGLG